MKKIILFFIILFPLWGYSQNGVIRRTTGGVIDSTTGVGAKMATDYEESTRYSYFYVTDYGAKGDSVTDDTEAIQAAINACMNAGGGTVYFPFTGKPYIIAGSLQPGTNSQLVIPHSDLTSIKIKFEGAVAPHFNETMWGYHISSLGQYRGVTLLSTIHGTGYRPSIIASEAEDQYQPYELNWLNAEFKDIGFVCESYYGGTFSANHTTALNLSYLTTAQLNNVYIGITTDPQVEGITQVGSGSCGVILPPVMDNNETTIIYLTIIGYDTALVLGEHAVINSYVGYCNNIAIKATRSYHSNVFLGCNIESCKTSIYIEGYCELFIYSYNTEHNSGNGEITWWGFVSDITKKGGVTGEVVSIDKINIKEGDNWVIYPSGNLTTAGSPNIENRDPSVHFYTPNITHSAEPNHLIGYNSDTYEMTAIANHFPLSPIGQTLYGHWGFDGDAMDMSGNGYNGTNYNFVYSNSVIGKGLHGNDKINSYLTIPALSTIDSTTDLTISLLFKCDSIDKLNPAHEIIATGHTVDPCDSLRIDAYVASADSSLQVLYGDWHEDYVAIWVAKVVNNGWHHLVIVISGSYLYTYLDGVLTGTPQRNTDAIGVNNRGWLVGKWALKPAVGSNFDGWIDDLIIDMTPWTAAQVQAQYNKYKGF